MLTVKPAPTAPTLITDELREMRPKTFGDRERGPTASTGEEDARREVADDALADFERLPAGTSDADKPGQIQLPGALGRHRSLAVQNFC